MVLADDLGDLGEFGCQGDELASPGWVLAHDLQLVGGERARLGEDGLGHDDLADVVEPAREFAPPWPPA
jgi:hypothetical protein